MVRIASRADQRGPGGGDRRPTRTRTRPCEPSPPGTPRTRGGRCSRGCRSPPRASGAACRSPGTAP